MSFYRTKCLQIVTLSLLLQATEDLMTTLCNARGIKLGGAEEKDLRLTPNEGEST